MKTLDEVIEKIEKMWVCPSSDEAAEYCDFMEVKEDALQYLKAYKDDRDDLTALRAYWAEQQANPPLTWEELKGMEDKPIWVECKDSFWAIVVKVEWKRFWYQGKYALDYCDRELMGEHWQAYRKERQ